MSEIMKSEGSATTTITPENNKAVDSLMLQFLQWIVERPRTYSNVMDAWRSSCPKHTTWEDAVDYNFVEVEGSDEESPIRLSERGRLVLQENRR